MELLRRAAHLSLEDDEQRIAEAIGIGEKLLAKDPNDSKVVNALTDLYVIAGRMDDLGRHLQKMSPGPSRLSHELAVTAVSRGAEAARQRAALVMVEEQRRSVLYMAAGLLDGARRYELAADLAEASSAGEMPPEEGKQSYAKAMRATKRWDAPSFPSDDPRHIVERVLALGWTRQVSSADLADLAVAPIDDWDHTLAKMQLDQIAYFRDDYSESRTLRNLRDRATSVTYKVEGSDAVGYQVSVESEYGKSRWYVVKTPKGLRLLAGGRGLAPLGRQALARLDAADLQGACQWLDWTRPDEKAGGFQFDPFSSPAPIRLWSLCDRNHADDIRLAASALIAADGRDLDAAIKLLESARLGNLPAGKSLQVDRSLLLAYLTSNRHADAEALCKRMLERHHAPEILYAYVDALIAQGKKDDVRSCVKDFLEAGTTNAEGPAVLAYALNRIGDFSAASDLYKQLGNSSKTPSYVYNNRAWLALFLPEIPKEALEDAQQACQKHNNRDTASLHTLATLQAYLDKPNEAIGTLAQAVDARPGRGLQHEDWLVLGRIAEAYGKLDLARMYYERVNQDEERDSRDTSYHLAQKRLEQLAGK
jgi:tetratricopeptide (TPR) repeat protein